MLDHNIYFSNLLMFQLNTAEISFSFDQLEICNKIDNQYNSSINKFLISMGVKFYRKVVFSSF